MAELADDEIRMTLDGDVTLPDLAKALTALGGLLDAVAEDVGAGHIDWVLTDLCLDGGTADDDD
jgi:hypothetical protein